VTGVRKPGKGEPEQRSIPNRIIVVHLLFIAWVVLVAHYPLLVVLGFLFFLAFVEATRRYQVVTSLRGPLLVGFFLLALVIHGRIEQWWIEPVLSSLSEWPLMIGAMLLTALNDNAAITYLASLVPGFSDSLKYAVVAGAVAGGGLTVIANALNPAGQSILVSRFGDLSGKIVSVGYLADRYYGSGLYAAAVVSIAQIANHPQKRTNRLVAIGNL